MTSQLTTTSASIDRGQGAPTLVFLHYFSGAATSWQWVISLLEADFRCVAIDLPGFGQAAPLDSPTLENYGEFVRETLSALGIDRYVLIGHSMGAKIALQVAASATVNAPQQVILVAPSPPTQEPMPEAERQRLLTHHSQEENAATTVDSATRVALTPEQRSLAIHTHMIAADSAWRWWLQTGMHHSIAAGLDQVQMPVSVIASEDDPVIPFDVVQQEVVALLPQAQLVTLSGMGHLIPLEAPAKVAIAIRQQVQAAAIASEPLG